MEKYQVPDGIHAGSQTSLLLNHIEQVLTEDIHIDATYAATLIKYHKITKLFLDFYVSMSENSKKDTQFPNVMVENLIKETGFL